MYACMNMQVCMHVCMYEYVYICMYTVVWYIAFHNNTDNKVHTYTHIHTYIHTYIRLYETSLRWHPDLESAERDLVQAHDGFIRVLQKYVLAVALAQKQLADHLHNAPAVQKWYYFLLTYIHTHIHTHTYNSKQI